MMKNANISRTSFALLRPLSPRAREVIERRFGLKNGEPETLESIGQDFGVTRERVRQIEEDGLRKVKEEMQETRETKVMEPVQGLYRDWVKHLKAYGEIQQEDIFLANIAQERQRPHGVFLLTIGEPFLRIPESEDFYAAWSCNKNVFSFAQRVVTAVQDALGKTGQALGEKEMQGLWRRDLRQMFPSLAPRIVFSYAALSKRLGKGPHGAWGLKEWSEVSPRGLRDRAYLVYKKENRPLHFTEVARLIDFHGFNQKGRKVLVQSVHNDLIRDARFVLVGRGMYALKEWGYEPGVVRDVIVSVLQRAAKPLAVKEVAERVLKQRHVKTGTVLLNLQNKEYFVKTPDGKYTLAKVQETTLA